MKTTILANKEPMQLDVPPVSVIVHQAGIRVDVPDFFEINSRNTIECMEKMTQEQWDHIRTGGVFEKFFDMVFKDSPRVRIPKSIKDLNEGDLGVVHACGMIVLMFEHAFIKHEKIFLRTPEDHLHPREERNLMTMIGEMQKLCSGKKNSIVATTNKKKRKVKKKK